MLQLSMEPYSACRVDKRSPSRGASASHSSSRRNWMASYDLENPRQYHREVESGDKRIRKNPFGRIKELLCKITNRREKDTEQIEEARAVGDKLVRILNNNMAKLDRDIKKLAERNK